MNFTKVHALGNDFLLVEDNQSIQADRLPDLTRQLCERHTGVGADGLILIKVLDFDQSLVSFRIFNADGSEAEISGNGLRCASAVLF
ncbi:MAG: diaminopimelate epimerase, partial [Acidobacteria bacterium]|nr:diaminopimelate epimerase [Acidobacteriota bacterium]